MLTSSPAQAETEQSDNLPPHLQAFKRLNSVLAGIADQKLNPTEKILLFQAAINPAMQRLLFLAHRQLQHDLLELNSRDKEELWIQYNFKRIQMMAVQDLMEFITTLHQVQLEAGTTTQPIEVIKEN